MHRSASQTLLNSNKSALGRHRTQRKFVPESVAVWNRDRLDNEVSGALKTGVN